MYSRLYQLWCWLWYGHNREAPGHSIVICGNCGKELIGLD